jgi:hypothetical protein
MRVQQVGIVASALLALTACGSDPEPEATGKPMSAPAQESGSDADSENRRPVIDELHLSPARPRPGETLSVEAVTSDPDGDTLRIDYLWRVDGVRQAQTGARLPLGAVGRDALIEVTAVARDGASESEPVSASARVGNQAPTILAVAIEPLQDVSVSHDITATPRATDPEGDELEYSYAWTVNGEPAGNDDAKLPAAAFQRGDRIRLRVVASDGEAESEPLESADIVVGNAPPTITSAPGTFDPDGSFRYQVVATDPDRDSAFRYRVVSGPEGLSVDLGSGLVRWQPKESQVGSHKVAVEVDDRRGGVASQSFEVRVQSQSESVPAAAAPPGEASEEAETPEDES